MARFIFGGEVTHIGVEEDAGNANAFKRLTAGTAMPWRATPGGAVVTDFLLWDGAAYTIVSTGIVADANGYAPAFQGPDGVEILYDPNGYALVARDAAGGTVGAHTHDDRYYTETEIDALVPANPVLLTGNQTIAGTKTFSAAPVVPDGSFTTAKVAGLVAALAALAPAPYMWSSYGNPVIGVTGSHRVPAAQALTQARMRVATAAVGSAMTAQLQRSTNSGGSWTTLVTLTIAAGSTTENAQTVTTALAAGDWLRLNVTSVGSTTAATGVVVEAYSA